MGNSETAKNQEGRPLVRISWLREIVDGSREMAARLPDTAREIRPDSLVGQIRRGRASLKELQDET